VATTGTPEHLAALQDVARARGLTLDAHGLTRLRTGRRVKTADEAALFERLGLPLLPPEVRDDAASIAAALAGDAFDDLIAETDLRGAVHCHTDWSDGVDTVEAMAREAEARGFEYLTITDHSQSAHYAGGLTPERLRAQWAELARVQPLVKLRLLRGTECDILPDGALDWDDDTLAQLDVVIASIHARNRQDEDAMTRRLTRALEHPAFKIWGHPLGRLVLRRPPVPCRLDEVLDAAARGPAAIEVNGDPYRLDLEPHGLRAARARGLKFVISFDAHSASALDTVAFGIGIARRGWVRKSEVLNTLSADAFAAAVAPVGAGRAP
jgi:DNA polymerase (family X)